MDNAVKHINEVCNNLLKQISDLSQKAEHDVVYFKGAREAIVLVAAELTRNITDGRQQQSADRRGNKEDSVSEISPQRAKRQKATNSSGLT